MPANDACALATAITALPFDVTLDTTGATEDAGDPIPTDPNTSLYNTVWYSWVADRSGSITADVVGCNVASGVAVFTGACGSFTEVASGTATATWTATLGITYLIMVGTIADGGGSLTELQVYASTGRSTFYTSRVSEVPWSPSSFQGTWNVTTALTPVYGTPNKAGSNVTDATRAETSAAAQKVACLRVMIGPLRKQTIGGTFNVILEVKESNADADAFWAVHGYISQGESNSVRGTIINNYAETSGGGATEWTTTSTGREFQAPIVLSAINVQHGDWLILELGGRLANATTSSRSITIRYGSGGVSLALGAPPDLALGETPGGIQRAGTLIFSQALLVYEPPPSTNDLVACNKDLWLYDGATGALKRRVFLDRLYQPAGGAQLDGDGDLYIANETADTVLRYDTTLAFVDEYDVTPGETPHATVFNESGRLFVGNVGDGGASGCGDQGTGAGSATSIAVRTFQSDGTPVGSHAVTADFGGSNAIDLAADQDTLYYSSIGPRIRTVSLVSAVPGLFVNLGGDAQIRGLRILPDGGLLAAIIDDITLYPATNTSYIGRFASSGLLVETYSIAGQVDWGTVTITSEGLSFYSANTATSGVCAPMIAKWTLGTTASPVYTITGATVPNTGGFLCSGGITAWNGYRAATTITESTGRDVTRTYTGAEARAAGILENATTRWVRRGPHYRSFGSGS